MKLSTDMTTGQLLAEHNQRAEKPLTSWKASKAKLIERIEALPKPKKKSAVDDSAADYKAAVAAASVSRHDAIHVASEKLLTAVAFRHEDRDWGLPYNLILAEIMRVFPDAETTVACLRWYAVHLNRDGVKLPFRKRSKS